MVLRGSAWALLQIECAHSCLVNAERNGGRGRAGLGAAVMVALWYFGVLAGIAVAPLRGTTSYHSCNGPSWWFGSGVCLLARAAAPGLVGQELPLWVARRPPPCLAVCSGCWVSETAAWSWQVGVPVLLWGGF